MPSETMISHIQEHAMTVVSGGSSGDFLQAYTPSDMMNLTNTTALIMVHTLSRGDGSSLLRQVLSWIVIFVSAGAVLSNLLVLALFVVHRPLRTCTNALVASLTVADLIFGATLMVNNMWREEFRQWMPSCLFIYTVLPWSSVASPWSLLAITVDRYVYVRLPLVYCRKVGRRTVGATITVVWVLSLSFALLGFIPWPSGKRVCAGLVTRNLPFMCLYLGLVVVPCAAVALLYCLILQVARRSNRLHQELLLLVPAANSPRYCNNSSLTARAAHCGANRVGHQGSNDKLHHQDEDQEDLSERTNNTKAATSIVTLHPPPSSPRKCRRIAKTTRMFLYLTIIFFVLWLPMHVSMSVLLFCAACKDSVTLLWFARISIMLYTCTPMINPWLYTLRNRDFRVALRAFACCRRFVSDAPENYSSSMMSRNSIDANIVLR